MNPLHRTAALFALVSAVMAAPALGQERAWLDVNIGIAAAAEDTYTDSVTFPFRLGTAEAATDYNESSRMNFEVGGGYMFHPRFGAGVTFAFPRSNEDPARLRITIPHPTVMGVSDTDDVLTDDDQRFFVDQDDEDLDGLLRRSERSVNLQFMAIVTDPDSPLSVRAFGGPTYFRIQQDTVDDIVYLEAVGANSIAVLIDDYDLIERDGSGWGFHVGGDVRYFFTDLVGVGGLIRFSRGEVDIPGLFGSADDPPPPLEVKAGGLQFGVGLRVRF